MGFRPLLFLAVALLAAATPPPARGAELEEEVKAAFVVNFIRLTEWPDSLFSAPDDPIRIGMVGGEEVRTHLERFAGERLIHGRPVLVSAVEPGAAATFHVLYFDEDETASLSRTSDDLAGAPVLLVGETASAAPSGAMIGLILRGEKMRFQVRLDLVRRAGLKLSSKLLRLAERVGEAAG